MPTPFSSQDLSRVFDGRVLTRGRSLQLSGGVGVQLDGDTITGTLEERGVRHTVRITPSLLGRRVVFDQHCTCGIRGCAHLAAAAFVALDQFPVLRKAEQQTFLDTLVSPAPEKERQRTVFELAPAAAPHACAVTTMLIGERSGIITPTTPGQLVADETAATAVRDLAKLLGAGSDAPVGVPPGQVAAVLQALVQTGLARWHAGGRRLVEGEPRAFASDATLNLPPRSGVIVGDTGPWYVDAATGAVGVVRVQPAKAPPPPQATVPVVGPAAPPTRRAEAAPTAEPVIVERPHTPLLRLTRLSCPDERGRMETLDALLLEFDYDGAVIAFDDERQFARATTPDGAVFVRRDLKAEAAAREMIRQDGLAQVRVAMGPNNKERQAFVFRGRGAPEAWEGFVTERLPALQAMGWRSVVDPAFGPRLVDQVGLCDVQVSDAPAGGISLDLGIEIDGTRHPLLPILLHLRERGGMDAARVVDGELITSTADGRILRLPAERIARLLAVIDDLMEATTRAPAATCWNWTQRGRRKCLTSRISSPRAGKRAPLSLPRSPASEQWASFRMCRRRPALPRACAPISSMVSTGCSICGPTTWGACWRTTWAWARRRRRSRISQSRPRRRLDRPALVVVPTSLVPHWTAELARFAPHLNVAVLYGLDRHERRRDLAGVHVAITTYTVLVRDIEEMAELPWHLVVLDEAQAIKSPDAKATRAVCRLSTRHRLCLSGTPIENNLGELWSQFAFLMPGLLGHRKTFTRRFRTPIEKNADPVRRRQLASRIRPFILRRTKGAVAAELPPKHTILRRITLSPEQRELYETIRATVHARVKHGIAARGVAQSHVLALDALLKLRQVCCDPRLVKLPSASLSGASSKLDDLLEMVSEMVAEGRRILLFSQFTSMLDLIKPALAEAGIGFVELRGDTADRAEPIQRFEGGEVPLFLISLKAGGRGLNLTSADTVIHYDPWWNPAVEEQASDRAHRIGQTKSVFVYKLVAADTVEERIIALQERKAELANVAFGDDAPSLPSTDGEDIDFLFGAEADQLAA